MDRVRTPLTNSSLAKMTAEHAGAKHAHAAIDASLAEAKEAHTRELADAETSRSTLTADFEAKIKE